MKTLLLMLAIFTPATIPVDGQHGGKAEPKPIEFASGRTSTTLTATLGRDEEMEYVFAAKKGQKVTVTNPRTSLFDVRICSDENNVETEFDSSRVFSMTLPADGDYLLYVRRKMMSTPRRASFYIRLTIR